MEGFQLIATGAYLPAKVVTNDDLSKIVETSDEWISTRTGIRQRRFCAEGEDSGTMAIGAARQALENSGLDPKEIGCCLCATISGRYLSPSNACLIQQELGLAQDIPVLDINAACSGFVYGAAVARGLLAARADRSRPYALVIGCEHLSRLMDMTDRSTCVLFGDGAGAAILEWGEDYPSLCAVMGSRGNRQVLMIPGVNTGSPNFIHMDGKEVFRFAVDVLPKCAKEVAAKAGISLDQVDRFVFHQANQRILDYAIKKLKIDPARCAGNIARTGNTSAASVPLLLDELITGGELRSGQRALCVGFGGGLTWAGALLELA